MFKSGSEAIMAQIEKRNTLPIQNPMDSPVPETQMLTEIMLMIFRINGRLLSKGDDLVRPLQIASAQWQVLGAVSMAERPLSAPQIAEAMGITRQGVQKQLNRMMKEALLEKRQNPRHERSSLYKTTPKGQRVFSEAMRREAIWAKRLADSLPASDLQGALDLLKKLHRSLDAPVPDERDLR